MQQPRDTPPPKQRSKVLTAVLIAVGVFVALWILVSLAVGLPAYRDYQERKAQEEAAAVGGAAAPAAGEHATAGAFPGTAPPPASGLGDAPAVPTPAPTPAFGSDEADAYVRQSKVNTALIAAGQLKLEIVWHHRDRGVCPVNGVGKIAGARDYNGVTHRSMFVGRTAAGDCGIEITLQDSAGDLPDGAKVWLEYAVANDTWRCHSDLPNDFLPADCRS